MLLGVFDLLIKNKLKINFLQEEQKDAEANPDSSIFYMFFKLKSKRAIALDQVGAFSLLFPKAYRD